MPTVTVEFEPGWLAEMTWPEGRVQGGPTELRVHPVDAENPPVGGISIPMLRQLNFRAVADTLRGTAAPVDVPERDLGPLLGILATEGVTDEVLVSVADLYSSHVSRGGRNTVARLAEAFGRSEVTIRSWLTRARKKGYLTGAHGKLAGELTEKAKAILDDHGKV